MTSKLIKSIGSKNERSIGTIAVGFLLLIWFGPTGVAQSRSQKRITSLRLGADAEGSRVTLVSDSALNDYEAYKRGDRFYVKIPASDLASSQPHFRGNGFEEVQVQKIGDSVVLSFRLQPGATARVNQQSNTLEVVFTTLGSLRTVRSSDAGKSKLASVVAGEVAGGRNSNGRQNRERDMAGPPSRPRGSRDDRRVGESTSANPSRKATSQGSEAQQPKESRKASGERSNNISITAESKPGSTATSSYAPENATRGQPSQPSAGAPNASAQTRGGSIGQGISLNRLVSLIVALLILSPLLLVVSRSRSKRRRLVKQKSQTDAARSRSGSADAPRMPVVTRTVFGKEPERVTGSSAKKAAISNGAQIPRTPAFIASATAQKPGIQDGLDLPLRNKTIFKSSEAKSLIAEELLSTTPTRSEQTNANVKTLLAGREYDTSVIDATDSPTRQIIEAELLAALAGDKYQQHEPARRAFLDHGYFDETTRDLRTADSPNERAAAACKLGLVRSSLGTAHLIAALYDSAPEVRRSAVESLEQIGDPAAISALNDLLLREVSHQLPEAVIRQAINSITVSEAKHPPAIERAALGVVGERDDSTGLHADKQETFLEFMESMKRQPVITSPGFIEVPSPGVVVEPSMTDESVAADEARLRVEEEVSRRAVEEIEARRVEADAARLRGEAEARIKAEEEARARAEVEAQSRAEEEARKRAEEEASQAGREERLSGRQDDEGSANKLTRLHDEEEARFRLEAETLRRAAEDLARRRFEAEAARRLAEEEARQRAADELRLQIEEEAQRRVEEETRRRAEEQARRRAEEEGRRLAEEQSRQRAQIEAHLRAQEEARRLAEEEETRRRLEEEGLVREVEDLRSVEEERLRLEQEALMQAAAELSRRRAEVEEARKKTEEESRLLREIQERIQTEEEARHRVEQERQRLEADARCRAEEERQRLEKTRPRLEDEQRTMEEKTWQMSEGEERRLAELEDLRKKVEEKAGQRAEKEQRIRAEIEALRKAEGQQRERIEVETRRRAEALLQVREASARAEGEARARAEAEAFLRDEDTRYQAEEEARLRKEEDVYRMAEEARVEAEEKARCLAERDGQPTLGTKAKQISRRPGKKGPLLKTKAKAKSKEQSRRTAEKVPLLKAKAKAQSRRTAKKVPLLKAKAKAKAKAKEQSRRVGKKVPLLKAKAKAQKESRRVGRTGTLLKTKAQAKGQSRRTGKKEPPLKPRAKAKQRATRGLEKKAESKAKAGMYGQAHRRTTAKALLRKKETRRQVEEQARLKAAEEAHRLAEEARLRGEEARRAHGKEPLRVAAYVVEALPLKDEALINVHVEKGVQVEDGSSIPLDILKRLSSVESRERIAALAELAQVGGNDAFRFITRTFDDQSADVRNAAARALYDLESDRAGSFTRALREASPERRRNIGAALEASGLASDAIGNLTGESREKTYDAFSLLFLMAKAGEVQPLMQAIEDYPNLEARVAVVKLLALSGQPEINPAFRRLAVRGSLPSEVRSAMMEAIYQTSPQTQEVAPSAA